jgi:alkylation response protein AidB-like acyl-CoA dehydrogenase
VGEPTAIDHDALDAFERTARAALAQPEIDVTDTLERIGWRDFLDADPASAVPLVFGLLGELLLTSTALDDVAFNALGEDGEQLRAAGHAFAHPGRSAEAVTRTTTGYHVDALLVGGRRDVPIALVADEGVVSVSAAAFEWTPVVGIDPELGLVRVRGVVEHDDVVVRDELDAGAVVPACRRALAHELLGTTDAMLSLAAEYAKMREQFGQPIGAFQAVKHRLADVYVARQAAAAVIGESWSSDPECTTLAAKALAATAGAAASEHCLQVLGAIGFTLEHDLHRHIRRVRVLDRLYGSDRELRTALGRLLQARGRVPRPGAA